MPTRTTWAMILAGLAIFITLVVMLVRDGKRPKPTVMPEIVMTPMPTMRAAQPTRKPGHGKPGHGKPVVPAHLLPRQRWSDLASKPILPPSQRPQPPGQGTPAPYIKHLYSGTAFKQTL